MTRQLTVVVVLAIIGVGAWLYRGRSSSEARIAEVYSQRFRQELQKDSRFEKLEVGVWKLGTKGPIYVRGAVLSEADEVDLRRKFAALGCPVGLSWQVTVTTNQPEDMR